MVRSQMEELFEWLPSLGKGAQPSEPTKSFLEVSDFVSFLSRTLPYSLGNVLTRSFGAKVSLSGKDALFPHLELSSQASVSMRGDSLPKLLQQGRALLALGVKTDSSTVSNFLSELLISFN